MRKSNHFKGLVIATALLFAGFGVRAQQLETSVFLNGILPVAQFNNEVNLEPLGTFEPMTSENIAKGAAGGLGGSARIGMWFDVGVGQLQPFFEAGFLWNNSRSYIRNKYDNNERNNVLQQRPKAPQYFNLPLMLGLKYRYDITPDVRPFVELGLGYDLLFISKNGYPTQTFRYKPSGEFSWMIGAGTYLGEYVSVSLFYMGLGNHHIDYSSRSYQPEAIDYSTVYRRSLGELGLRVGFHF